MAKPMTRREFLRKAASSGSVLVGSGTILGALAACGAASPPATASTGSAATGSASAAPPAPSAAAAAGGQTTTLRLMAWGNPQEVQAREETIKAFQQAHPDIAISFLHNATDEYLQKLNAMIAGGDAPDIIYLGNGDMWRYAEQGTLLPLSPLMQRDGITAADIYPEIFKLYEVNGTQYGLPADAPNQELFLNLKMFEDAGIAPPSSDWKSTDWTWDAFLATAQKLTVRDASGRPTKYGFLVQTSFRAWWVWVVANGGRMFSEDGSQCLLDQPEAVEAFQFLADLIHVHKVAPTVEAAAELGGADMFLGGNLGMVTNFPALARFRQEIKDWTWDVAPHPAGKAGKACAGGGTGHHIAASTKNPDQAWTFLKWMISSQGVEMWTQYMGIVPPLKTVATKEVFLQPGQPPEHVNVFTEGLAYLSPDPRHPKFPQVVSTINQELDVLWNGQRPAAEVLASAVQKANAVITG